MKLIKSKKGLVLLATFVVAVVAAIGGYAYFTSSGSGTGTATVGTSADDLYIHGAVAGTLLPGGPSQTVSFTADNPENFRQSLSNIHLASIGACSAAWVYPAGDAAPTCLGNATGDIALCGSVEPDQSSNSGTADFYMADIAVNPSTDGDIAANAATQALTTTGLVTMNDTTSNQDACKNAHLNLVFSTT